MKKKSDFSFRKKCYKIWIKKINLKIDSTSFHTEQKQKISYSTPDSPYDTFIFLRWRNRIYHLTENIFNRSVVLWNNNYENIIFYESLIIYYNGDHVSVRNFLIPLVIYIIFLVIIR